MKEKSSYIVKKQNLIHKSSHEKRKPSIKEKVEALERDFCTWLEANQSLPYEKKRDEIISTLLEIDLSHQMLLELAVHMLIRMGQANFVVQRERKFEVLYEPGYAKLRMNRKNREIASLPRKNKKSEYRKLIKDIMRKEKRRGIPFKNFLENAESKLVEDLEIEKVSDKRYRVRTLDFNDWVEANEKTILDWYSESEKKKSK